MTILTYKFYNFEDLFFRCGGHLKYPYLSQILLKRQFLESIRVAKTTIEIFFHRMETSKYRFQSLPDNR